MKRKQRVRKEEMWKGRQAGRRRRAKRDNIEKGADGEIKETWK